MHRVRKDVKTVSVIIPIYNTEQEVDRCLRSICNQTYKALEIICIDDGSTDRSGQIADSFAQNDCRIKVIHQVNGGESNARNMGLKVASGAYIAFCDCDDWIDENMYEVLVQALEKESLDVAIASWYKETGMLTQEIKNKLPVTDAVFGRDELLKYLYMRDSYRGFSYMWDKLYRKEILRDREGKLLLFDETLQLGGDVLYLAEIALNINRAKYVDRAFYHYNQRQESGCHTKDVHKLRDWLKAYEMVIQIFEKEHINGQTVNYVKRFLAYHSSNAAEIAIAQRDDKAKAEFQKFMLQYEQEYISLNMQYPERILRYQNLMKC